MIKTIIFDLGGVYFTNGTKYAIEQIKNIYDIKDNEALHKLFSNKKGSKGLQIRLGLISMDEFENEFISLFNIAKKEARHLRYIWFSSYIPNFKMEDIVRKLKKMSLKLITFSGNIRERIKFLENRYHFLKYFDNTLFSYDYQLNKENKEFYKILINHIN
ncbi:MAG: hypothetical protein ACTSQG_08375, partial [Promethearchaeota archaeon]